VKQSGSNSPDIPGATCCSKGYVFESRCRQMFHFCVEMEISADGGKLNELLMFDMGSIILIVLLFNVLFIKEKLLDKPLRAITYYEFFALVT
jgi:hypothetical protein